jgi:hypothetical protein
MITCWVARKTDNPDRFRVQLEPFDPVVWRGWELRYGGISEEDWTEMGTTSDGVRMEVLHRDLWARAEQIG